LVKSLRSQHFAAGAVVLFEGEIAGEMYVNVFAISITFAEITKQTGISSVGVKFTSSCVKSSSGMRFVLKVIQQQQHHCM
jgi:hypothetical protein